MNKNDLTGRRFGKLTVAGDSGQRKGGCILWNCRCDCGGEILALRYQLESGNAVSCGCVKKIQASRRQAEDLTGRRFGELTVLRRAENDSNGSVCWVCRCSCGRETTTQALQLKSGKTRSCGCMRHREAINARDLTDQRFGRLTALYRVVEKNPSQKKAIWHCRCDCGREVDVYSGSLVRGLTRSCGCWNREQSEKMHDHMHYRDDTCVEVLKRFVSDTAPQKNKAGFRGLFLTKSGKYRVMITFQKVHYSLGYYKSFDEAVRVRLDAEQCLHEGYIKALARYEEMAKRNPAWARGNPFYYRVARSGTSFQVDTNRLELSEGDAADIAGG